MTFAEKANADAVSREVKNFIDGAYRGSSQGRTFDNVDPCTGNRISRIHEATREDVDTAVQAARRALAGPWGTMSAEERSELLRAVCTAVSTSSRVAW